MPINSINDLRKALTVDFDRLLDLAMESPKVQKELIELNQREQLSEGIDAQNKKIITISAEEQADGTVYSHYTIFKRGEKGLQVDNVDLKDSGKFWETMKVSKVPSGWEIIADFGVHGEDIRDNFSDRFDFLGLTNDNLDYFVHTTLLPQMSIEFRKLKGF